LEEQGGEALFSNHSGYHAAYNRFVKTKLDDIERLGLNVDDAPDKVYELQQKLKVMMESGVPLYKKLPRGDYDKLEDVFEDFFKLLD